jgi:ethanolamine-phosphate phospho-lyase
VEKEKNNILLSNARNPTCNFKIFNYFKTKIYRGVILPPDDFIRNSVDMVRKTGGVFIADEVQTGFGRLGSTWWAFEQGNHGVVPDIMTVGKPFGNGISLGAVIMTRAIADHFDDMGVEYFNTFGGSPVAAAAGLAVLDVIEEERLQDHALEMGKYLIASFWQVQNDGHSNFLIGDIRGSGLFLGIELVRNGETKEPAATETSFLCTILKQKYHILTSIDGLHENVLVIKPPLIFSKEDADYFVQSFSKASQEVNSLTRSELTAMSKTPT